MSIKVELDELRAAIDESDRAPYLVTTSDDLRPHTVAVQPTWDGDELVVAVGNRTLANSAARPAVCLLWPPTDHAGYSLIVDADVVGTERTDGDARDDANRVRLRPTRAVRHRPAPGLAPDAYDPDCVTIPVD